MQILDSTMEGNYLPCRGAEATASPSLLTLTQHMSAAAVTFIETGLTFAQHWWAHSFRWDDFWDWYCMLIIPLGNLLSLTCSFDNKHQTDLLTPRIFPAFKCGYELMRSSALQGLWTSQKHFHRVSAALLMFININPVGEVLKWLSINKCTFDQC